MKHWGFVAGARWSRRKCWRTWSENDLGQKLELKGLPSELLEKKSWDECDEVVLRCRDFVALELLILKLAR